MARPSRSAAPKCAACGRALPWLGGDERNKVRGRQGDGLVCGVKCGWRLAMMIVQSVPDVLTLLPPKWQRPGAPTTTDPRFSFGTTVETVIVTVGTKGSPR